MTININIKVISIISVGVILTGVLLYVMRSPQLVVVDTQVLLRSLSQRLSARANNGPVPEERLHYSIQMLRKRLNEVSHDEHIVMLAKHGVLGGDLPDITNRVHKILFNEDVKE